MKSQLFGWNKQQVDHYLQELQSKNEQQLLADAEMMNRMYADLSAIHRDMLEASQQLVLAREQAKKLEDIDKVTIMMRDKLVKEAEGKARDMIAAAYEEALEHRRETESIRLQIKTLSNEYKQMVNQIQERIGVQMQAQPSSSGKEPTMAHQAMAATRDYIPQSDHELEVIGGQNNKIINFIRPVQAGPQRMEEVAPPAAQFPEGSSFFDPEPDALKPDIAPPMVETKEMIAQDQPDLSVPRETPAEEDFAIDLAALDRAFPGAVNSFYARDAADAAGPDGFSQAEEIMVPDTPQMVYQETDSLDVTSLDLTGESIKFTSEAAATQPAYMPARPAAPAPMNAADMLLHRGLDEKQALYIIGNMAGADLVDDDGQLIIAKGNTITPEIVNRAFVAGRLIDLVINMELPGFDEPQT